MGLLPDDAQWKALREKDANAWRTAYIDALLADNRPTADHWHSFWNDLLRNDYRGTGFIDGGPQADFCLALQVARGTTNPNDQFVRELISPTAESEGFINGIKWRGNVNASQTREVQFSQNISQVFFAINMKCASCHDSFVDNWKLKDAYGLAAIFAEQPLEIHRCDKTRLGSKQRHHSFGQNWAILIPRRPSPSG